MYLLSLSATWLCYSVVETRNNSSALFNSFTVIVGINVRAHCSASHLVVLKNPHLYWQCPNRKKDSLFTKWLRSYNVAIELKHSEARSLVTQRFKSWLMSKFCGQVIVWYQQTSLIITKKRKQINARGTVHPFKYFWTSEQESSPLLIIAFTLARKSVSSLKVFFSEAAIFFFFVLFSLCFSDAPPFGSNLERFFLTKCRCDVYSRSTWK